MALIKRAWFPGEQDGEPLVRIVRPGVMEKTSSAMVPEVQDFISKLRPDPRYTYVLVNAMGYSEFFGANSNKDYYGHNHHLDFNGLLNAPSDWGADACKDLVAGKKWLYGFPTYYGATVYAHHKNSCRDTLGFGDVIFVMPNHRMKRIELVMRVDNELAAERGRTSILDRIQQNARVDVSMGCKVPFDFCSICTDWEHVQTAWKTFDPGKHAHPGIAILHYHRGVAPIRGLSITRADYCEHMRLTPGAILPDGRKVYVYNDFPRFFDISFVWIGADKTARVMWYMGGKSNVAMPQTGAPAPSPFQAIDQQRSAVKMAMEKRAENTIFFKRGEIEKEIPATYAKKIELCASQEPDLPFNLLGDAAEISGPKTLLSTLAALGIVLKPREFHMVVTKGRPMGEKLAGLALAQNAEFNTFSSGIDDTYAISGDKVSADMARVFQPAAGSRSSFAPHLGPRVEGMSEGPSSFNKEASVLTSDVMNELAAQYNGYRLSILEQAPEVFPKYASLSLGPMDLESFLGKTSSILTKAVPLLLGLGPMIHLVSAHLRKKQDAGEDLGTMAKFVAENPTFTTIATIGAGLRVAMGIQRAGGLGLAVKGVVSALRTVV
ncbi:MAG: hypothetical protein DRQ64_00065 [Gammaproteobacteria bacterium]|nr:MAG: hypothetical protein DRQ64_00065 [Gammaproteobacteria bacterium]